MKTKTETVSHTPGPWTVHDDFLQLIAIHCGFDIDAKQAVQVCLMDYSTANIDPKANEANARLIAAAPDLLAALKKYADFVRESGRAEKFDREAFVNNMLHATDLARAAIAKAEGRS